MNPRVLGRRSSDQIPGEEEYLYTGERDMKCCIHICKVWECPEAVCLEEFPSRGGFRGGLTAYKLYQETLKLYKECPDINEAAKVLGVDPSNVRRRFKWLKSITG